MTVHIYNPDSTWEIKPGGLRVQGHKKFESVLNY